MHRTAALLLLLSFTTGAFSQDTIHKNSIGFSTGIHQLEFLDHHASPLLYKTSIVPVFGLFYQHQSLNSFFEFRLSGGAGNANPERFGTRNYSSSQLNYGSDSFQISSGYVNVAFEATYLRKLKSMSNSKLDYWLGPKINESAYYADEVADFPWLMNIAGISPVFKMRYKTERQLLGLQADFSVISIVSREIYALFPKSANDNNVPSFFKQGTRLTSLNEFQQLHLLLFYNYRISKRISLGAAYRFEWFHYSVPKPVKASGFHFYTNIEYHFH